MIEKSEVAGAKEGALPAGQMRSEYFFGFFRLVPVATRHAGAGNPNFSHAVRGAWSKSFGIDNHDAQIRRDSAATHQNAAARFAFFRRLDAISLQLLRHHGGSERHPGIRMP